MVKILKKIDWAIEKVQNGILVVSGTAVTLIILINALLRALKMDWFGSEEVVLFIAFWLYYTGGSCAARDGTHVSASMMSLFTSNKKVLRVVNIIKSVIALAMCSVALVWAWQFVAWQYSLHAVSAVYKMPMILCQLPIVMVFFFWTIYMIRDLVKYIRDKGDGAEEKAEEEKGDETA